MKNWRTPQTKALARAFTGLRSESDMLNFLRDLMTLDELDEISSRWQAVELIEKGMSYREISRRTGLSTTTVARVAHWLHNGEGGYRAALKK